MWTKAKWEGTSGKRENNLLSQEAWLGTSLVVQWLRLSTPNARGLGSIPGQGTRSRVLQLKNPHATAKRSYMLHRRWKMLCATNKTWCYQRNKCFHTIADRTSELSCCPRQRADSTYSKKQGLTKTVHLQDSSKRGEWAPPALVPMSPNQSG